MGHTQPRVAIAIPYRGTSHERERNLNTTTTHLQTLFPWPLQIFDSPKPKFDVATARNLAVHTLQHDYDVILICDADTLIEQQPVEQAVQQAFIDDKIHNPFTLVQALDRISSKRWANGNTQRKNIVFQCDWGVGSAYVTAPKAWWDCGGQDERFTGWGYEDTAMKIVHEAFKGPMPRHEGVAIQLWHPLAPRDGDPDHDQGVLHYQRYQSCEGDPLKIRELING